MILSFVKEQRLLSLPPPPAWGRPPAQGGGRGGQNPHPSVSRPALVYRNTSVERVLLLQNVFSLGRKEPLFRAKRPTASTSAYIYICICRIHIYMYISALHRVYFIVDICCCTNIVLIY